MKKLIIILTIDFIVAGFVLFLFQPTPQTAEQGNGNIRDYVYPDISNSNKKTEQVSLPGVLVTAKKANYVTADVVKSKHNVNYKTKHSKLKNYKFISKNRLPVTWYKAIVRQPSNDPDPLKLNASNASYNRTNNLSKVSANY